MLTKDKVHQLIDHMPENVSTEDLIGKIILLQKIEIAQKEIVDGEGTDWDDLKKEVESW
ncbi:hypothetical protein [Mucilaginibacter sp. UYCu711]|uniref:hypothetical protein n=1 Tax=Mucilaginibacter sp. UYCu711 TaxID=3156339 RepID=UPI003D21B851